MLNRLEDEEDQKNILLLSLRQKKQFIRLAPKKKNGRRPVPPYDIGREYIFKLQEKLIKSGACGNY